MFGVVATADPRYRDDRIIVKPKAGNAQAVHAGIGAKVLREYPRLRGIQVVKLPRGLPVKQAIERYRRTGLFEYVEPDYEVHVVATPNDPYFVNGSLYGMTKISAPAAWDVRSNANPVIVAVIDTGIDYTHPDLAGNMWTNPGEIPGNSVDDDGDGYVDDVYGINSITGTGDPKDDHLHGTHCAGTIGGVGNNGIGVVGVAWHVRLMACKFLDAGGYGSNSDAIECINYAVSKGADILSNSWGCQSCYEQALRDAIAAARDAGVIFVAAAGNSTLDIDGGSPFYPAGYDVDNIVSVAATDSSDALAYFSNWGNVSVDLAAPGVGIWSTYPTYPTTASGGITNYNAISGTSMATPHVAGALALVTAQYSSETYSQIIWRVLGNVDLVPALDGRCVTGGRLNLLTGLTQVPAPLANFASSPTGALDIQFTDKSLGPVTNRLWSFGDGASVTGIVNPTHTYPSNGLYDVTLTVFGPGGSSSKTKPLVIAPNYFMLPQTFSWVDPADHEPLHMGDDDVAGAFLLPFPFTFYGQVYSNLYIGSNGLLGFEPTAMNYYINSDIPSAGLPNTQMYALWDDLNPYWGNDVWFGIIGTAPNRIAVATWLDAPLYWDPSITFTFQVLLYEGGNQIVFQYLAVDPQDGGVGATVGVENQDGTVARKYSYAGSAPLTNGLAIAFTTTTLPPLPPQPQPSLPDEPLLYSTLAIATNRIDLSWFTVTNATGYIVKRDGAPIATTQYASYSDTTLQPDTRYCYSIIATNSAGNSPETDPGCATTLSVPVYALDGAADFPGYLHIGSNMTLYAAVHGQTLYVATWSPGTNGPNDHFIFVSDNVLPAAIANAPWAKAGLVAVQPSKPFLGGESENDFVGWFIDDNAPNDFQLAGKAPTNAGQMEGTLDLITTFGYLPDMLWIAAAAYETGDSGVLVSQSPAGNGDGNLDPSEFIVMPVVTLLDRNLDGTLDRLDPAMDFKVVEMFPSDLDFEFVWNCVPHRTYQVQFCDELTLAGWQDLPDARLTAGDGDRTMAWADYPIPVARRFYRVKLVP